MIYDFVALQSPKCGMLKLFRFSGLFKVLKSWEMLHFNHYVFRVRNMFEF